MRGTERAAQGKLEALGAKLERAVRRQGGLPEDPAELARLVLGPRTGGTMSFVGARRQEFEAAKEAGGGSGELARELAGLSAHIRGRACEDGGEALREAVADAIVAIAGEDRRAFRRAGWQVAAELRAFLESRPECAVKVGGRLSPWAATCAGAEALRASWSMLERQRREEEEQQQRQRREQAADARLDEELEQRVRMLDEKCGGAPPGGAGDGHITRESRSHPPQDEAAARPPDSDSEKGVS